MTDLSDLRIATGGDSCLQVGASSPVLCTIHASRLVWTAAAQVHMLAMGAAGPPPAPEGAGLDEGLAPPLFNAPAPGIALLPMPAPEEATGEKLTSAESICSRCACARVWR